MKKEEKLQILQMIESKQITLEEGMKLLDAVEQTDLVEVPKTGNGQGAEWIRVRVVDGNNTKVNVNLPFALLEVAINIGKKFIPQEHEQIKDIDFDQLVSLIKQGANGKLVEVQDGDTTVEVIVE